MLQCDVEAQTAFEWTPRRLLLFSAAAILQSGVRLDIFPERICILVSSAQTGSQIQGFGMRDLPLEGESTSPPFGFQSREQLIGELNDAVRVVSHEMALAAREDYTAPQRCNTDELRLLGNGVYPAVAAKAFVTLYNKLNQPNRRALTTCAAKK